MSLAVQPCQLVITLNKLTLDLLCIIKGLTLYLLLSTSFDEAVIILINHIISLITVSTENIHYLSALCFLRYLLYIFLRRKSFMSVIAEVLKILIKIKRQQQMRLRTAKLIQSL